MGESRRQERVVAVERSSEHRFVALELTLDRFLNGI